MRPCERGLYWSVLNVLGDIRYEGWILCGTRSVEFCLTWLSSRDGSTEPAYRVEAMGFWWNIRMLVRGTKYVNSKQNSRMQPGSTLPRRRFDPDWVIKSGVNSYLPISSDELRYMSYNLRCPIWNFRVVISFRCWFGGVSVLNMLSWSVKNEFSVIFSLTEFLIYVNSLTTR